MKIDDYDQVYDLWLHTAGMDLNALDESRSGVERYLKRNPHTCFVEEDENGKIIGAILAGHDGRRGTLHHLAVKKTKQGKGIGRRLAEAAINALKEEGIIRVALFVYNDNEIGMRFWKKLGFIIEDEYAYLDKDLVPIKPLKR